MVLMVLVMVSFQVTCEPFHGEMVILKPPSNNQSPPFDGNEVCMPQLEAQVGKGGG